MKCLFFPFPEKEKDQKDEQKGGRRRRGRREKVGGVQRDIAGGTKRE